MLALVALTFGHVFMVFTVDPYSLRSIITGGYDDSKSPELRNARPFVHLRAASATSPAPPAPDTGAPQPQAPASDPPVVDPPPVKDPGGKA